MSEPTTETLTNTGASDPSMEDILASIRRIIADDAQEVAQAETSDSGDVRQLAPISQVDQDQNKTLINPESAHDTEDSVDFDDILIMDDDDFAAVELEIPDAELFAADNASNGGLLDDDMDALTAEIQGIIDNSEPTALNASPLPVQQDEVAMIDVVDVDVSDISVESAPVIDIFPETVEVSADIDSGDDLLAMFDNDIDLILDMEDAVEFTDVTSPDEGVTQKVLDETVTEIPTATQQDILPSPAEPDLGTSDLDAIALVESLLTDDEDGFAADEAALDDLIAQSNSELGVETIDPSMTSGQTDMSADDDLDLVKSLMADLTDEALLEAAPEDVQTSANIPAAEIDVMDDILELTMADEAELNVELDKLSDLSSNTEKPSDEADIAVLDETADIDDDVESVDASINALLQIAASAEMEAVGLQSPQTATLDDLLDSNSNLDIDSLDTDILDILNADPDAKPAFDLDAALMDIEKAAADIKEDIAVVSEPLSGTDTLAGMDLETLLPIETEDKQPDMADELSRDDISDIFDDTDDNEVITEPSKPVETNETGDKVASKADLKPEPTPEQENPEMPQLVAKDAILDDVTEVATAEAFASLNQVVEDKAVFAERGPRIGDLVQDALRPMLKEWLDGNLKGIVERAVAKEVKRISTGK